MKIHSLRVSSFRLFKKKELFLKPGVNLLTGCNAVGKTTLLEALYLLITGGRSFRTAHLADLVQSGGTYFRIESHFEKNGIAQSVKMRLEGQEKRVQHKSTELFSSAALLGLVQGVLLAPQDIELIKGSPQVRRHYLDLQLAQVDPLYVHHLIRYTKALKQRNWMLRMKQIQAMEAYEGQLALAAAYLIERRMNLVDLLEKEMSALYQLISGKKEALTLSYHSSFGVANRQETIAAKLHQTRSRDLELGATSFGPHRDELRITLHDKEAKHFASEGEMRSLSAALRLAEWRQMQKMAHEEPLLLVDDFGISLDEGRLKNLSGLFEQLGQVVITSVQPIRLLSNVNCIEIL
jgi:DNA replication and repair protein RecF